MNSTYDLLKDQGWKYEKEDFGSTSCSLLTPPAGAANGSPATSCATVVKGMLVMTGTSSKASIPAEKLKSPLARKTSGKSRAVALAGAASLERAAERKFVRVLA